MKPKLIYKKGKWWCFYMGVTGCGKKPKKAYKDMKKLYRDAIKPKQTWSQPRARC